MHQHQFVSQLFSDQPCCLRHCSTKRRTNPISVCDFIINPFLVTSTLVSEGLLLSIATYSETEQHTSFRCIDEMNIQRHDVQMTIQHRIRQRRRQLGLSMNEVATACGVAWQSVQRWETTAAPKRNNLLAVSQALNVNIEWLVTGKGPLSPAHAIDFSKLSGSEAQLVMYYRSMNEPHKEQLLTLANTLSQHSIDEFGGFLLKSQNARNIAVKRKKS